MKKRKTQKELCKYFGIGQPQFSKIKTGAVPVPWNFASTMHRLFPEKPTEFWRGASPEILEKYLDRI